MTIKPWRSILCLIAALGFLSCPAAADEDGAFCTAKGYIAYEVHATSSYGVPQHVLHIVRFEVEHGIYEAGEVTLNSFQVHGLICTPDRVEISGWGNGFEHYMIGVPPPSGRINNSLAPRQGLHVLEHHSDPAAKFDPSKDTPEPQWLWHEPVGAHPLGVVGRDRQYFLVIAGADESGKGVIKHRSTATLVEENQDGISLHTLPLYQHVDIETID